LGGAAVASPAQAFSIQVVNLPDFTILDTYVPLLIIVSGIIVLIALLWSRIRVSTKPGVGSKVEAVPPLGYKPLQIPKPMKREPREVRVIEGQS
jgi:hypothetical protein